MMMAEKRRTAPSMRKIERVLWLRTNSCMSNLGDWVGKELSGDWCGVNVVGGLGLFWVELLLFGSIIF